MKGTRSWSRAGALALLLVMLLTVLCPVWAAEDDYQSSGGKEFAKMSKKEIAQLLKENPVTTPENVFVTEPSVEAPFAAGEVSEQALQAAADRLSALRRLAGLPGVEMDLELCRQAQYGAVLLSASQFSHTPSKPEGMDQDFYTQGYAATSSSNIAGGRDLVTAVDLFMDDTDSKNISALGHRRWQLNPAMGKVGFGYAYAPESPYRHYVTEKVFDQSGVGCDYDFIAWPSSGYFPAQDGNYDVFDGQCAWSVTVDPSQYGTPQKDQVTVKLTRGSDGRVWEFSAADTDVYGKYFNVERSNYGVSNCIIFRPDGIDSYEGLYTVEIEGLSGGTLAYQVDFFNTEDADQPEPSQYFIDVNTGNWYFEAVEYVYENGIMSGTNLGVFQPALTLNRAQAVQILYNLEEKPAVDKPADFTDVSGWYADAVAWASENDVVNGVGEGLFAPNAPVSREQFAQMLYNYACFKGYDVEARADLTVFPDHGAVSSWAQQAMEWANGEGLINGSDGKLVPGGTADRGQAASILMKFSQNVAQK